jgi:hypothetical protein
LLEGADVLALNGRPGLDRAAARRNLRLAVIAGFGSHVPDQAVEVAWPNLLSGKQAAIELLEHAAGNLAGGLRPGEGHDIPMGMSFDTQSILDQAEMSVVLTQELGQEPVVLETNDQSLLGVGSLLRPG